MLISWEGLHFGAFFRFAKVILRGKCSTSYDLASLFRGRGSTWNRWNGKIAKRIGTRPSALHSTFQLWRRSRRIVSFLVLLIRKLRTSPRILLFLALSSSKIGEVSQNWFVFNLAKRQIDRELDNYNCNYNYNHATLPLPLQIQKQM